MRGILGWNEMFRPNLKFTFAVVFQLVMLFLTICTLLGKCNSKTYEVLLIELVKDPTPKKYQKDIREIVRGLSCTGQMISQTSDDLSYVYTKRERKPKECLVCKYTI